MSLDMNRIDLARHEAEFDRRLAFAYTMVDRKDPTKTVGCVYINPPTKEGEYLFKLKGVRPLPLPCSVLPCPSCRLLRYCIDDAAPLLFAFCAHTQSDWQGLKRR